MPHRVTGSTGRVRHKHRCASHLLCFVSFLLASVPHLRLFNTMNVCVREDSCTPIRCAYTLLGTVRIMGPEPVFKAMCAPTINAIIKSFCLCRPSFPASHQAHALCSIRTPQGRPNRHLEARSHTACVLFFGCLFLRFTMCR